ncbi:MAG: RNA polymerase sigma-70 factor [Bacteroidales bacterium]|nr:RNA polymerase sigma-70 factor [Bacteroidales bacterium]
MNYNSIFINQLKKKDQKSFERLYLDFFPSLVVFAQKYIPDQEISEDIVQEVFIKLWDNASKIDIHTSLKSYLYSATKNSAINYLNKKNTEERQKERYLYFEDIASQSDENNALTQDVYYHLYNAIKNLPEKSRKTIILSLNNMSLSDIKNELNISINTVKTHKRRAYSTLRKKLAKFFCFFVTPILIFFVS